MSESVIAAIRAAKTEQHREQAAKTVGRNTNQDFMKFKSQFLENLQFLHGKLLSVFSAKNIDIDELYNLRNEVFSSMEYEMDAILYLNAVYSSEHYIVEHCLRVGLLANIFAKWLGFDEETTKDATIAGFIHDIGMLEVPARIIEKEGILTQEEYKMIREHTSRGAMVMAKKGVKPEILNAIRAHHERFDGSGYPDRKKADEIGQLTALISIVDVYDSMTSNRPYSLATCPFEVINEFEKKMLDKFNPGMLYVFLENIPYMYKNALVQLSSGDKAHVVFINKNNKTSPIVRLEKDDQLIDLATRRDIKITGLL